MNKISKLGFGCASIMILSTYILIYISDKDNYTDNKDDISVINSEKPNKNATIDDLMTKTIASTKTVDNKQKKTEPESDINTSSDNVQFWAGEFQDIYNRMFNKDISEEEIEERLELIALALEDSPELRENFKNLYTNAKPYSAEKYFIQEMLAKSDAGIQVMNDLVEKIAIEGDVENYEHMLQMADIVGPNFSANVTGIVNDILVTGNSSTPTDAILLHRAIKYFDDRNVAPPYTPEYVTSVLRNIYDNNSIPEIRNSSARRILSLANEGTKREFALIAIEDDALEIKENVLFSIRYGELVPDTEIKHRVRELSYNSSVPPELRLSALSTIRQTFNLEAHEIFEIDRQMQELSADLEG